VGVGAAPGCAAPGVVLAVGVGAALGPDVDGPDGQLGGQPPAPLGPDDGGRHGPNGTPGAPGVPNRAEPIGSRPHHINVSISSGPPGPGGGPGAYINGGCAAVAGAGGPAWAGANGAGAPGGGASAPGCGASAPGGGWFSAFK
jgi:hypothetical protein